MRLQRFAIFGMGGILLGLFMLSASLTADEPVEKAEKEAKDIDYYELMKTFADTFDQIERNYVEDVDARQILEAGIRGMLTELDPYSAYISPEEISRFNQNVEQEFGGIGIQVALDPQTKRLTVMTPLPGTPAYKAGILAGDIIEEIAGESTEGYSLEKAIEKLKGRVGESVKIGVRHIGSEKIEQMEVTRDIIQVATVLGDYYNDDGTWNYMVDPENKIAYIRLTHFSRRSSDELIEALQEIEKAGFKGLILDLRFDPGGLLSQAIDIADLFIEDGRIVSTKGRNSPERVWTAKKEGTYSGFPMAVLVNRYSASASEILSAALQDHDRAVVIGERTWGKGSVQNVIELEEGQSALKLTTASYHRPSGENIHRFPGAKDEDVWGVMPNEGYKIEFSTEEIQNYLEHRRTRDVLKKGGPGKAGFEDRQLNKAVDYILGKLNGKPQEEKPASDKPEAETPEKKPAESTKGDEQSLFEVAPKEKLTPAQAANRFGLIRILPTQAG